VGQLWNSGDGTTKLMENHQPVRVKALAPTYEALLVAIRENQAEVETRQERHRNIALGVAKAGIDAVGMVEDAKRKACVQAAIEESEHTPEALDAQIEEARRAAPGEFKTKGKKSGKDFSGHMAEVENAKDAKRRNKTK
jgi:hypothetical protein